MGTDRPHSHRTPLSKEELDWLHKISERTGLNAADVIRQFIRKEHARIEEEEASKGKKGKR